MQLKVRPTPRRGQSGQAAVETALVVPMMVFLVLGIIQLGMVHHARLMTEYGAYRAVRAGIVNHGDCRLMERAALMALVPTLAPLNGRSSRVDTLDKAMEVHSAYAGVALLNPSFYSAGPLPLLRVQVVNPKAGQLDDLFSRYGSHMNEREIDYDDVRDDEVIEANLLSVRLTYFYEMRIPFANWQLHSFYMGREYLDELSGVQFENQRVGGGSATRYLESRGASRDEDHRRMSTLASGGKYVLPLVATWSMRMQSNLFNSQRGPRQCAVDS